MDGSAQGALRDANGRFTPGQSGNPAGKRPGTRNRATLLREALRDGEDIAAARLVIDKALAGNAVAARFVVGRLMPRPRGREIELDLPEITDAAGLVAAFDATLRAMAAGEITPDEALQVTRVLDSRLRALRAATREEASIATQGEQSPSPLAGEGGTHCASNGRVRGLSTLRAISCTSPLTLPAARVPSLSREGRGAFWRESKEALSPASPAFRLHFPGEQGGAMVGARRTAPYLPQPSPGGSPMSSYGRPIGW